IYAANTYILAAGVIYATNTSIHAAGPVCAGSIMFLLADLFLLLDIAGWLVSATSHLVSAGVFIPAGVSMHLLLESSFLLEFHTPAFAQFHAPRSTDVLPQADISES
ncbi:hypothetical protein Tco_0399252, partial [Tanacetum coccineum]